MSRDLSRAIHQAAAEHAERAKGHFMGAVVDTSPLTIDLYDTHISPTPEDGLVLSQWAKYYDANYTINVDDEVIVRRHGERWVIIDVISDTEL